MVFDILACFWHTSCNADYMERASKHKDLLVDLCGNSCLMGSSLVFPYQTRLDEKRDKIPKRGYFIIALVGVACGFTQLRFVSKVLFDVLTLVTVITKIPSNYLALMIIAPGNAIPNAMFLISLSKQGLANMSMHGGYAN